MENDFRKKSLHLFVLSALSITQPLLDILGKNGSFLIALNFGPTNIALLTLILMVGLPLVFIFITFLAGLWSKPLREGIFISIFVLLAGLTVLPAARNIPVYSGTTKIILSLFIGLIAYMVYRRHQPVKLFFSYLAPLVFIFPINFAFYTDASKVLFPKIPEIPYSSSTPEEKPEVPVFLIVLDEFPITSLMDERGMVDSVLYPNFSELSKNSHWFRNTIAVSEWTDLAVPAILTGRYPSAARAKLVTGEDYPESLFTLLEPHYELKAFEEFTKLCFSKKCEKPQFSNLSERTLKIYSDLTILFGHSVLPADYTKKIPSIQNKWKNFGSDGKDKGGNIIDDRIEQVENFMGSINPQNKSTLYFLHLTLPHSPTIYLPSGKAYDETDNTIIGRQYGSDSWSLDNWLVTQAYQRHLLQVGYADKVIGRLLEKLKASGIYDEALLIVTADHGISFLPGERARGYTQFNYPDILSVPLFIKLPQQKKGSLRIEPVKVIDILPTIADTLGLEIPWPIDGRNPFEIHQKNDTSKNLAEQAKINNSPWLEILKFPRHPDSKYKTLKKKYLLFGSGSGDLLYQIGPGKNLLGSKVADALNNQRITRIETLLEPPGGVIQVDKNSNYIPSWITGTVPEVAHPQKTLPKNPEPSWLTGEPVRVQQVEGAPSHLLAIAVNGVIQATTQTNYISEPGRFAALVPERAFHEGINEVSVFKIINGKNSGPAITTVDLPRYRPNDPSYIWNRQRARYTLTRKKDRSFFLSNSNGKQFKIPQEKAGYVELVRYSSEAMYFFGFIKGLQSRRNEIPFLIFNANQFVFADKLLINPTSDGTPEDINKVAFRIPVYQNKRVDLSTIRVFLADEKGGFMEMGMAPKVLAYPKDRIPRHHFYGALSYCQDEEGCF